MQVQAQVHSGFVEPDEPDANVRPAAVYVRLVAASESESVELVLVVLVLVLVLVYFRVQPRHQAKT